MSFVVITFLASAVIQVFCEISSSLGQFEASFFLSLISTLVAEYVTTLLSGSITLTGEKLENLEKSQL